MLKFIVNQLHCFRFFIVIDIHISQGSVATHLRCGGIFNDFFIASFLLSLAVKEFENRSIFGETVDKSIVSRFLTHGVECTIKQQF